MMTNIHRVIVLAHAVLLTSCTTLAAADLALGLVGQWRFDDCDGKSVRDLSRCDNDGVIVSGTLRKELGTTSLELDGLDGHVQIELRTPLPLTSEITTVLWVKVSQLRNQTVLYGIPNANPDWTTPVFGMYGSAGRVVYGQFGDSRAPKALVESQAELPLAAWTFLAATSDGARLRLYVNGELDVEQIQRAVVAFNGQPLLIGKGAGAKPSLRGRVGELRIYNRALSADEVRTLFDQTRSAYDLTPPVAVSARDGTVPVETHGSSPAQSGPWRVQPTRLLELVDGYAPSDGQVRLNRYGGRLDLPPEQATGFFHMKKIDGRWWLIDPEGRRFFHIAINAVREPRDMAANFGSADRWAEAVTEQLRSNGFNGLGNWSVSRLQQIESPLVWVLRRDFLFAFARSKNLVEPAAGTQGFLNRCMPVFHPEFQAFCEEYGRELAKTANDPTLLGIMTENEIQCPYDLLDRYLASDATNPDRKPGRDAALAWLTARKGSADPTTLTRRDRYEFIAYAFDRYYRIVTPIVRKYDPNHLYLGSRLNYSTGQFDNPWFWKMLAPYHDVVSVNYYHRWGPQKDEFSDWAAWADKPILMTEWYSKAMDVPDLANTHGAGWLVRTQEDRARFYQHFALGLLETRNVVGWHYFKYLDDPPESKALDNLGGANKGMFDVYGMPYQPLLDRARAIHREVYPLIDFFDARQ